MEINQTTPAKTVDGSTIPPATALTVFVTMNQLAQRYCVSRNTIGTWVKARQNDFPSPIKLNGRNLWTMAEIEAWDLARMGAASRKRDVPSATYVQPTWARPKEGTEL